MMTDQPGVSGPAPVTDRRSAPSGVLPRRTQTWLMAGLALGIVLIVVLAGHPEPPARPASTAAAPQPPNADRVRVYQDRLRAMEARAALDAEAQAAEQVRPVPEINPEPRTRPAEDPVAAERRRKDYESLFASNVVLSRRPEAQRPDPLTTRPASMVDPSREPSMEEIADAVVRATTRAGAPPLAMTSPQAAAQGSAPDTAQTNVPPRAAKPASTEPISAAGPVHRILEGTLVDAVLTNRLDGGGAAPVNCLVTNPVYSHGGEHVLIPAGARMLGETKPVQMFGETRLGVAFHRLLMPNGRSYALDQFVGLNQIGDSGLRDRVNQHYLSTFGAAGAVGLISGLAQWLGTAGFAAGTGDRTVIVAGGTADATSQATTQVMSRFLNRLPTITIREGHRVKIYLTSDLDLPAYEGPDVVRWF